MTAARRLVASLVDAFAWVLASLALLLGYGAVDAALTGGTVEQGTTVVGDTVWLDALPGALLFFVLPLLTRGRTVGRWATSVRPVTAEHRRPSAPRTLAHSLGGLGGLWLLWTVREQLPDPARVLLLPVGLLWVVASVVLIVRGDHRGLSGALTGLRFVDSRDLALLEHDRGAGRRRPLATVRVVSLAAFVAYAALLAALHGLDAVGGAEGVALLAPVLGTLVASQVVAAGYLIGNGLVMLRKEGRSLGNLLSLLAGLGAAGLVLVGAGVVLVAGDVLRTAVLVASVLVSWAATVFLALVLVGRSYGRAPTTGDVDALVVLGSRVVRGRVPPLLAARLETAERVREEVTPA